MGAVRSETPSPGDYETWATSGYCRAETDLIFLRLYEGATIKQATDEIAALRAEGTAPVDRVPVTDAYLTHVMERAGPASIFAGGPGMTVEKLG